MAKRNFFSEREIRLLRELVNDRIHIVESRALNSKTVWEKRRAWAYITKTFNSSPYVTESTEKQLKKCWNNLKSRSKSKPKDETTEYNFTERIIVKEEVPDDTDRLEDSDVSHHTDHLQNGVDAYHRLDDMERADRDETNQDPEIISGRSQSPHTFPLAEEDYYYNMYSSAVQQRILDRQEVEHKARMKLLTRKLEMAEEKHALKMKILNKRYDMASENSETLSCSSQTEL